MPLPKFMQAIEISKPGGPDVLDKVQRPLPCLRDDDILIRVQASGVNRPDCLQRAGVYPPPPEASDIPGLEAAGEIVAMGSLVTDWETGDRITALTPGGGYAEYVTAPAAHALPWPTGYDALSAAALPETFFTVWHNVFTRGGLQPGETLLVHGGSSGVGTTAIQLAKAFGAKVIVTAGTAEKCAFCLDLGADHAINYRQENWPEQVQKLTKNKGVDVIFDMVAGPYIQDGLDSLAKDGRYLFLAFLQGPRAEINFTRVLTDRLTLTGSTLRPQSVAAKAAIAQDLKQYVWPLLNSGRIRPVIDQTFALQDAAKAHILMESSRHMGKIMLRVSP